MNPTEEISSSMSCQKFETPFFRALNASYVPGASVKHDPLKFKPQVCNPHVPANKYPLAASLFEATDDWKWLNSEAIYDVREEATLHQEKQYKTTLRTCRAGDRGFAYINKSWNLSHSSPGVIPELWLYKNTLKGLMGTVVPRLIALRSSPGQLNLAFEIPHHTFFIEPSTDMPEVLKRRTVEALEKLHKKGVFQYSANLQNILIGADGNVFIYNFHSSRCSTENKDVFLRQAKAADFRWEMRRLKFKLDYEGAREKEKAKLAEAVERKRRNQIALLRYLKDPSDHQRMETNTDEMRQNPPLDVERYENWLDELDREPRRFVVPGTSMEDFEWELKRFHNILRKMEDKDVEAGLMERPLTSLSPSEMPPSQLESSSGVPIKQEPSTPSPQRLKSGKLKRSPEDSEEFGPSKRTRQAPEPSTVASTSQTPPTVVERFKHDKIKPNVQLVAGSKLHYSIQENNLVQAWPMVVHRDFAYEPRPTTGEGLGKRIRESYQEEERARKRRKLDNERGWCSWIISSLNPSGYLPSTGFSESIRGKKPLSGRNKYAQGVRRPIMRSLALGPGDDVFSFRMKLAPNHAFPSAGSMVSAPLQSLVRVLEGTLHPSL